MERILNIIKKFIPKKLFKTVQPIYHLLLSWFSSVFYGKSSEKLIVIGVTGTTGKTTSVYLIAKMLQSAGYKTGYTSTAMFNDGKKEWLNDKKMTMAGRFFTQKILRDMVKNKCRYAIIETTSEGIRQYRHRFINYDILVFTGIYPEHIESHGGFENYKKAKGKLFAHLKQCQTKYVDDQKNVIKGISKIKKIEFNRIKKTIIVNGDDKYVDYFLKFWGELKFAYTSQNEKSIDAEKVKIINLRNIKVEKGGISFEAEKEKISLNLSGSFNALNATNAFCVGLSQGIDVDSIKEGLKKIKGIPGRFEEINENQDFTVIVDYAFEPNAVNKLYETVENSFKKNNQKIKIIHVLGSAGGGRDVARRSKLGEIAGKKADFVIVTNEDPYDEDPQVIINQVFAGAEHQEKKNNENLFKILDRRYAIKKALKLASKDDIVLITGKGSEQAICVAGGRKIKWDDREVVREELKIKFKKI